MSFCPNCGNAVSDGSKFCPSCGAALGSGATSADSANTSAGMHTVEEVQDFYRKTLQFQEKYVQQYTPGIRILVNSLLPGEYIEFASHGGVGGLQNGTLVEIAATNRRFIIANTPTSVTRTHDSLRRQQRNQLESYRYDTFSGITYQNGLLYGSVTIEFIDGTITVSMDKRWTQLVYRGLSASFYQHAGGSF